MLIYCAHSLFSRITPELVYELEVFGRLIRFHILSLVVTLCLGSELSLLLLICLLLEYFVVLTYDFWLKPAASICWIILNFNRKFDVGFDENLYEAWLILLRLIYLATIARWIHAACQTLLLLVSIVLWIVFYGLFFNYFIVVRLLDYLATLLLTSCKKVLNRDIVLRLNFNLLFVIKNGNLVPTAIKSLKFRDFGPWVHFRAFVRILLGLLLIRMNQVVDVPILMRQVLLVVVVHR